MHHQGTIIPVNDLGLIFSCNKVIMVDPAAEWPGMLKSDSFLTHAVGWGIFR